MHESTIKLMSTPVSTLPTLINEHIYEYLYGAYNVSTKDYKNLVNTMHSCIPVVIHYIAQGTTHYMKALQTLKIIYSRIVEGEYNYRITLDLLINRNVLIDVIQGYIREHGNTPYMNSILKLCSNQLQAAVILGV